MRSEWMREGEEAGGVRNAGSAGRKTGGRARKSRGMRRDRNGRGMAAVGTEMLSRLHLLLGNGRETEKGEFGHYSKYRLKNVLISSNVESKERETTDEPRHVPKIRGGRRKMRGTID